MKLGLLTGVLGALDRASAFARVKQLGFDAVELGTGEFTTDAHAGLDRLGEDAAVADLRADLDEAGLELSALSCHGNPLHPQEAYAARADGVLRRTIDAASALGVENVVCFSGCPGEPDGHYPNWITTPWPGYFADLLEWQWAERPHRDRDASGDVGVQPADAPSVARCLRAGDRGQLRPEPSLVAGHGSDSRREGDRPRRRALPCPRQG